MNLDCTYRGDPSWPGLPIDCTVTGALPVGVVLALVLAGLIAGIVFGLAGAWLLARQGAR